MFEEQFNSIVAQYNDLEERRKIQKRETDYYKKAYQEQMKECVRLRKILKENNIEF